MNTKVQCENCEHIFIISSENVSYQKEFKIENGQSIFLTYYDCPECGRRHWVQVDTPRTIEMLREQQKQFLRLSKIKARGETVSKKQSEKFAKTQKNLVKTRNNLMEEFTGKIIIDGDTEYTLRFSV